MGEEEEKIEKVTVSQDEYSGLIGDIAGQFLQDKIGGAGGQIIGNLVRGGADSRGGSGHLPNTDINSYLFFLDYSCKGLFYRLLRYI